jgi:NNP family nitrate/nitrite transporter-like MFS transporter
MVRLLSAGLRRNLPQTAFPAEMKALLALSFALLFSFMIWMQWSLLVTDLHISRPDLSTPFLIGLTSAPFYLAIPLRLLYPLLMARFGYRRILTLVFMLPAVVSIVIWLCLVTGAPAGFLFMASLLTGAAGANFAAAMAYANHLFPHASKSMALGTVASVGNLGIGLVHVLAIAAGNPLFAQLVPGQALPVLLAVLSAGSVLVVRHFVPELPKNAVAIRFQMHALKGMDSWLLSILYAATYGVFLGVSAVFPSMVQHLNLPVNSYELAFLMVFLSVALRPVGHMLAGRFGSVTVTWVGLLTAIGACFYIGFATLDPENATQVIAGGLVLLSVSAMGMGSVTTLITDVYNLRYLKKMRPRRRFRATSGLVNEQISAALGFTSALGTVGAILIPEIIRFIGFNPAELHVAFDAIGYALCISLFVLWARYGRLRTSNPFIIQQGEQHEFVFAEKKATILQLEHYLQIKHATV